MGSVRPGCIVALSLVGLLRYGQPNGGTEMVRFMDELHGSIGERVTVADLRNGTVYEGSIEALNEPQEKVHVRYDDGTLVSVGIGFVSFVKGEDEDDA